MNKTLVNKLKPLLPLISLPLIFLVCLGFWFNLGAISYVHVRIQNGLWDLRDFDFENDIAGLYGGVEFIPGALLTPEEFAARADEIIVGSAQIGSGNSFATSRVKGFIYYRVHGYRFLYLAVLC